MPFIVCRPNNNQKGILVFKHLEIPLLNRLPNPVLNEIKDKFNIIYYFGFHSKYESDIKNADGYISAENVLKIDVTNLPRLFLNGFNFIGNEFCRESINNPPEKDFDFIFVGDASRRKNLKLLIKSINRLLYDISGFKILIINRVDSGSYLLKMRNKYIIKPELMKINDRWKKNIVYIESDSSSGYILQSFFIKSLMMRCRALVIPSSEEGAARVVAEAKLLGLNIISNKNMKGGTNNYLDDGDLLFDGEDDLAVKLRSYLNNHGKLTGKNKFNYQEIFCEKFTRIKAISWFSTTYAVDIARIEEYLNGQSLYNSFSCHNKFLPRNIPSNKNTDECLSHRSILAFSNYLGVVKNNNSIYVARSVLLDIFYAAFNRVMKVWRKVITLSSSL